MWNPLLFAALLTYIGSSFAVPSVPWKYIFVSKRAEQGVTWNNFSSQTGSAEGYQPIGDQNRVGGEVAFFGGYASSFYMEAGVNLSNRQQICRFALRLNIMEANTPMPNNWRKREKFRILKQGRRYLGFRIVDRVYVAASSCWGHVAGLTQLYYAACAKISSTQETMYSRISLRPDICDKGDYIHHEKSFFAFVENCRQPEIPTNGQVELVNQTTMVGATASFSCRYGFWHTGSSTATCQADAIWHYLDDKRPECTVIWCPDLIHPDNGQAIGNSTTVDSQWSFRCDIGYTLEGNDTVTCEQVKNMEYGRWSGDIPTCKVMFCPRPTAPENGRVEGQQHRYGSVIRYSCNVQYRLQGADRSTCRMAGWDAQVPTCVAIKCKTLNAPANGHLFGNCGTSLGSQCIVTCDSGFALTRGAHRRRCTAQGWTGPTPNCTACPRNTYKLHPASDVCNQCPINTVIMAGKPTNSIQACRCAPGFTGDPGGPCTDVNECRVNKAGCNQKCENTLGSFYCRCHVPGYMLQDDGRTCVKNTCADPGNTAYAHRVGSSYTIGATVTYTCERGYRLRGDASITCDDDGRWSSQRPQCQPLTCLRLRTPRYGSRDSDGLTYGSTVCFSCHPGYQMVGQAQTTCLGDSTWSSPAPVCTACTEGFYKERRADQDCTPCPEHSTTVTTGNSKRRHCVCVDGAVGPPGGPCIMVKCESLSAPENGNLSGNCGTSNLHSQCEVTCDPGFVLTSGSRRRRCTAQGWTDTAFNCTACPGNTYKLHPASDVCNQCPINTVILAGQPMNSIQACRCAPGFTGDPGGPCTDVNECRVENDGCNQTCVNTLGSFYCHCHVPGYVLQDDGRTCIMNQSCPTLSQRPLHGSLQCRYSQRSYGHICFIRCDPGYFFVSGVNNYVTCGPESDFEWSHHQLNKTARIPACTREFFVDVNLPMSLTFKSTSGCNESNIETHALTERLEEAVNIISVCYNKCQVTDINITCHEDSRGMDVAFDVLKHNLYPHEVPFNCTLDCKRKNTRAMLRDTFWLKQRVEALVMSQPHSFQLPFQGAPTTVPRSFTFGRPRMICEDGRVLTKNRLCVPCDRGFYLPNRDMETCLPCPKGTYQDEHGQTDCKPCLEGSTTVTDGTDHPVLCSVRA